MKKQSAILLGGIVLVSALLSLHAFAKPTHKASGKKTAPKKAPTPEAAAQGAAAQWLALVDTGKYAASWDTAAPAFQAAVTRDQWASAAQSVRAPLGALKSRVVQSAQFTTTLPQAPPGEYVVIVYHTAFAQKDPAIETVAMMRDKDGKWKSSGYFIK